MHLSRIELYGFKSFPQRVEVNFNKGMTAIVGPNGSGKSNIADAVRWVLGEQSAKTLRGSKMEDVIFCGTADRKPLGYCEVALTIDNSDGAMAVDFAEVNIMRRLYRSGESEYFINRNSCRLKDIVDLFHDTGVGTDGYSMIGQGKVAELLSNKSEDRRAVFEEAAGVTRYRTRKNEAERRLEHTRANMVRLDDILRELELQMEMLGEQSATARQYLALRDELKSIELNAFLRQYDSYKSRIQGYADGKAQLAEEQSKVAVRAELFTRQCREQAEKVRAMETAISEMQHSMFAMGSALEKQTGEANVLQERAAGLLRENRTHEEQIARSAEKLRACEDALRDCLRQEEEGGLKLTLAREELTAAEEELERQTETLTGREDSHEKKKALAMEHMNRLADIQSGKSRLNAMRTALLERRQAVERLINRQRGEGDELEAELARHREEHALLQQKRRRAEGALQEQSDAREQAKRIYSERLDRIHAKEREMDALRSRINVLGEMKSEYEGYFESVRRLLRDHRAGVGLGGIVGVVGELIKVPGELETAVESALGPALHNIVTADEQSAKRAIEYLRAHKYGRATFLPITAVKGRRLGEDEAAALADKGILGVASSLVTYDRRYAGVVENLLGRTVIAEDMETGIRLARKTRSAFRIATLAGDLINVGGSMTGGSIQKREFSLLGRERELESLKGRLGQLEQDAERLRAEQLEAKRNLELDGTDMAACHEALKAADVEIAAHTEKLETIELLHGRCATQLEQHGLEAEQIDEGVADVARQLADIERLESTRSEQVSQAELNVEAEQIGALRRAREAVMGRTGECRVKLVTLQKEEAAVRGNAERLNKERAELQRAAESLRQCIASNQEKAAAVKAEYEQISSSAQADRRAVDEQLQQLRQSEQAKQQLQLHAEELDAQLNEAKLAVQGYVERLHRIELMQGKAEVELDGLQERVWSDYELTYEGASQYRLEKSLTASQNRTDEIKSQLRALGDVNVNAIEDYRLVSVRFGNLTAQREDLAKAERDLVEMIEGLMKNITALFQKQFVRINGEFGKVFKELFRGGRAELRLSDPKDVLNCDIQIIAQPPGKRLQLLSLLSGGERALTAIALLFAMLRVKPTPFCLLDEIEADLDEANVANFASYVRDYAGQTQFILITHRKGSMEVCDALYGVAMEEKGVSRLVSVRLSDYTRNSA